VQKDMWFSKYLFFFPKNRKTLLKKKQNCFHFYFWVWQGCTSLFVRVVIHTTKGVTQGTNFSLRRESHWNFLFCFKREPLLPKWEWCWYVETWVEVFCM